MKKNILILGGLGFIGQNLIEELGDDYNLIVFDSKKINGSQKFLLFNGNFSDSLEIENIFKSYKIDLVIHLISTTIPSSSIEDMAYDIDSNVIDSIKLLELIKRYSVPKILFISSGGAIYGLIEDNKESVDENHPTFPISPHAINKLAIEKHIYLYHYLYKIEYLILRLPNPYGEYHQSDKQGFINVALKKIVKKEKVEVWGNGDIIRDYIYIKDCVKIIHNMIKQNISNQIINVGSGKGFSINDILSTIKSITGDFEIEKKETRNFDVPRIVLNTNKLKSIMDFQLTNIEEGIDRTFQWTKNNYK